MKYLYLCCIGTLLCLLACTHDVELEQPDYQRQIVVDGWMETGGFANVYLTRSSPFLTQYDSASIRKSFLNYAKITLFNAVGDSEILTLFRCDDFFPPFVYRSVKMKGEEGGVYRLKVELEGKTVTATTSIPPSPVIRSAYMDANSDSTAYLRVRLSSVVEENQWVFACVKSRKADQFYHPAKIPLFSIKPSMEETITLYRSRETNLFNPNALEKSGFYSGWPNNSYALEDTVGVQIGSIDETSYAVLKSLYMDQSAAESPFVFNGAGVKTNIVGGIGRWTGIGAASVYIVTRSALTTDN